MATSGAGSRAARSKGSGFQGGDDAVGPHVLTQSSQNTSPDSVEEVGAKRWSRRASWTLIVVFCAAFWGFVGWLFFAHR
jgi:hypothetical protein